jgi:hypothetical protein
MKGSFVKKGLLNFCTALALFFITLPVSEIHSAAVPTALPRNGAIDGVTLWNLPKTDNGMLPTQCWHSVGNSPEGDIYVSGMDHYTNSALYRLYGDTLKYVGDAKSASQRANNWGANEYAEKFHTRPVFVNGMAYVAVLNKAYFNTDWETAPSGKWYTYNPVSGAFTDISAPQPGGVAIARGGFVTLAGDSKNNFVYGAVVPTDEIVKYDVTKKTFTNLGRPVGVVQKYVYCNRFMWIDSRNRLYLTQGGRWGEVDPDAIFKHVHYYDPSSGFGERKDWPLEVTVAVEIGQWNRKHTRVYMSDDQGRIYRFDENGPTWAYLSRVNLGGNVWVFHLSPDEKKIYIGNAISAPEKLMEYDITSKTVRELCAMRDLDRDFGEANRHTGYDAWDNEGRFYFTGFKGLPNETPPADFVRLLRFDPVRVKVAKGLLPALVKATADTIREAGKRGFAVSRSGGSTSGGQEILFDIRALNSQRKTVFTYRGEVIIPAGSVSVSVPLSSLSLPDSLKRYDLQFAVVPNGNDYVAGAQKTALLPSLLPAGLNPFSGGKQSTLRQSTFKISFSGNSAINFEVAGVLGEITPIVIMNIHGAVLKRIVPGPSSNNTRLFSWDLTGLDNRHVVPGMYIAYCRSLQLQRQIVIARDLD